MKLKAIFVKSDEAKRRKHQIRKERKKQNKQNMLVTHMGSRLNNPGAQASQGNPFANVFNDLM